MTPLLLRFAAAIVILCALLIGGSIATGKIMPAPRTAVFITDNGDDRALVTVVDVRQGTRVRRITDFFTSYVDFQCHLESTQTYGADFWPEYYDPIAGERRYVDDAYRDSTTATVAWLPDKRRLWAEYSDARGQMHREIFDTVTGAVVPVAVPGDILGAEVAWSPDSRFGMIYTNLPTPLLLETASGQLTPVKTALYPVAVWSPDSRYFASAGLETGVSLLDTTTLAAWKFSGAVAGSIGLAWTADNGLQFFGTDADTDYYQRYRWFPGEAAPQPTRHLMNKARFSSTANMMNTWSPDSLKFFFESDDTLIVDAYTGVELAQMSADVINQAYHTYTWSPDSRYLPGYFYSGTHPLAVIDTVSGQTTWLDIVPDEAYWSALYMPRWLSDGELQLFQQSTSTLGRLVLNDGTAEFVPDVQVPGAYAGGYCDPEAQP